MFDKKRQAKIKRKTNEVDIQGKINLDGGGAAEIATGFGALDHLLTLFSFHGFFDIDLKAEGDLSHHIVEDIGISLGKSFKEALGSKEKINRYGSFSLVMDKTVVEVDVDISGRPSLHREVTAANKDQINTVLANDNFDDTNFAFKHAEEFLNAFIQHAGISCVYLIKAGENDLHHLLEALFKALSKALDKAVQLDCRRRGIPSTKGIID